MKSKSKLYLVLAATALSLFLTACGGGEQTFTTAQVRQQVEAVTAQVTAAEATKADAKLSVAKSELKKLAVDTARQGGFSATANCNVLPIGFNATSAAKNFPSNAPGEYRAICSQEVLAMNVERKANASHAIAKAKQAERKLAANKAKRMVAVKAKAKQHQKG